jgi:hypothetical protein
MYNDDKNNNTTTTTTTNVDADRLGYLQATNCCCASSADICQIPQTYIAITTT